MFFLRLHRSSLISSALCLALLAGSSAPALARTDGQSPVHCKAQMEGGAPFTVTALADNGILYFWNVPEAAGLPTTLAVPIAGDNGPFSARGDDFQLDGARDGDRVTFTLRSDTTGSSLEFSCPLSSTPPPTSACALNDVERAIAKCMDVYAADHPVCAVPVSPPETQTLRAAKNRAAAAAKSYLPPWFTAPQFIQTLLDGNPELQGILQDIEQTCGEKVRIAVVPTLPCPGGSCLSGLFSAADFTVYLRDPSLDEYALTILLHELFHAQQYCRNEKKWPPPGPPCDMEREAMRPICAFYVTAFGGLPDPAIQPFLCSL